ncbi:MAG: hypothetical protein RMA76_07345 [Deltaproteobacteria bacterium]|jgi:hypothetical protein
MNPLKVLIVASLVGACASSTSTAPVDSEGASSQPFSIPKSPAYDLARRVAWTAGFDQSPKVKQLDFTFVVEREGKKVFAAQHKWDRVANRARITWTDKEGSVNDAVLDVGSRTAKGTVNGEKVVGDRERKLAEDAYGRWINDTYWFLLPIKLFDRGSHLQMAESRDHDGKPHPVLHIRYDGGTGLTSGDEYWLFVDPDAFRIVRWEMKLEGREGPPRGVSWESYRPVGPLLLAHDHRSDDGTTNVKIEDSAAHREVKAADFVLE